MQKDFILRTAFTQHCLINALNSILGEHGIGVPVTHVDISSHESAAKVQFACGKSGYAIFSFPQETVCQVKALCIVRKPSAELSFYASGKIDKGRSAVKEVITDEERDFYQFCVSTQQYRRYLATVDAYKYKPEEDRLRLIEDRIANEARVNRLIASEIKVCKAA